MSAKSPEKQLAQFMSRYTPAIVRSAKAAHAKLRALLPGAVEMVYDNYNALVIGFGPTERPSEAILSLVLFPKWITICFLQGATLSDPHKILKGGGKQVRNIRLEDPSDLDKPQIQAMIAQAVDCSAKPFGAESSGGLIIKSISEKQRPRRPKE